MNIRAHSRITTLFTGLHFEVMLKMDQEAAPFPKPETETSEEKAPLEDDPYAYLDRSDFSSEKFKIEIKNLPKIYGINV